MITLDYSALATLQMLDYLDRALTPRFASEITSQPKFEPHRCQASHAPVLFWCERCPVCAMGQIENETAAERDKFEQALDAATCYAQNLSESLAERRGYP